MRLGQVLVVFLAAACPVLPLFGHHSFSAQFDINKPIQISGAVTSIQWMNPHVYIYIHVQRMRGESADFAIETDSPNALRRCRWGKNSLRSGDVITVSGHLAKKGLNTLYARTILLSDGTSILSASCPRETVIPQPSQ